LENQKLYMRWLLAELDITPTIVHPSGSSQSTSTSFLDKLYSLSPSEIASRHGTRLLDLYGSSMYKLLSATFPEKEWLPWLFSRTPADFWKETENQKKYVDWLVEKVGVSDPKYLRFPHFNENRGNALLALHHNSVQETVLALYPLNPNLSSPTHQSEERNRSPRLLYTPQNYWDSIETQLAFLEELATKLGFKASDYDKWYAVSGKLFHEHGGGSLLVKYNSSVYLLLKSLFPLHDWLPWKFPVLPRSASTDPESIRLLLSFIEKELNIRDSQQWKRVNSKQLKDIGVLSFVTKCGGLEAVLTTPR